jgi:hypothetical protein
MAHRGRLNVLSQVMGKPHRAIFHEFKGGSYHPDDVEGSGDVKYHLGASSDREFDGNNVHLSLTANPSHLEIVDPVVLGKVRAKQDQVVEPDEQDRSCRSGPRQACCRCCCMAMRPLRARAWWPSASACRACAGTARRDDPLHHQQPDRVHHQSALLALLALPFRCGEDDRGADLPREWR